MSIAGADVSSMVASLFRELALYIDSVSLTYIYISFLFPFSLCVFESHACMSTSSRADDYICLHTCVFMCGFFANTRVVTLSFPISYVAIYTCHIWSFAFCFFISVRALCGACEFLVFIIALTGHVHAHAHKTRILFFPASLFFLYMCVRKNNVFVVCV